MARAARIAPPLARRIDRLARHAHAFHRFAHHPLCERYASELIVFGRRQRVCRGCALLLGGTLAGVLASSLLQPASRACASVALLASVPLLRSLLQPERSRTAASKLWTRALPGAAAGATIASALRSGGMLAAAMLTAVGLFSLALVALYRRRGPDRTACEHCPQRTQPTPCDGFREIVRAERAFQRRARQLLVAEPPLMAAQPATVRGGETR